MERDKIRRDVTIKDVAKRAGVAISTVSRVLNGLDKVSEKTEKKVREAVAELGYVQNALAVSMVTGQTKTILMVVPDFTNDFNGSVIQGAEEYLKARGYTMLISSTRNFEEEDFENLYRRFSRLADGILVVQGSPDQMDYTRWEKPLVLVDAYRPQGDYHTIEIDNERGMFLLTEELIQNGHRRIGLIGGIPGESASGRRVAGYLAAMEQYHIQVDERLMALGSHFEETGSRAMAAFLSLPEGARPTGIVAVNNLTCVGCMKVLSERGMRAGREISLAAFDDHLLARYFVPGVTVIERPTIEMGREGARVLLMLLSGEEPGEKRLIMGSRLIRRESVVKR
ncbi:MAG: LacI family transcriptional regulator [Lachnospiraceae bacterium]|jgi:DNA-binding LacI/PurR family transcriptional regulator|nr:LacI family transcriptional regulator [Lachnospiraceae bacterium]